MTVHKAVVRFTANFEADLASIESYWNERGAPHAYSDLLDELGAVVIRNLERHPRIGRRFLARRAGSVEVRARVTALTKRFGASDVREYLSGDYLVLYCLVERKAAGRPAAPAAHLLAIKHHLQLTFDFDAFWQANRADAP